MGTTILNDLEERNALSKAMASELYQVLEPYRFSLDVRVAMLHGVDGYFSAGGDVTSMKKRVDCYARGPRPGTQTKESMAGFNHLVLAIHQIEKPVVGWIEGACAGDGLGIAMVSDFSITDKSCKVALAFVSAGLAPGMGSSLTLMRHVGPVKITGLFMAGYRFTGGEAVRLDITTQAVPADDLEQTVDALAVKLAAGPVTSYCETKGVINRISYPDLYQCVAVEPDCVDRLTHMADHAEAVYAFPEKGVLCFSGT